MEFFRSRLLSIALLAQALLLSFRLDLLPLWDDERYTLLTAAQSPRRIIEAVRVDVHPPLYYFAVRGWLTLPLPGEPLLRARALSVIFTLAATAAFYALWLVGQPFTIRALFLGLWVLSPLLVLYGRMARSYALQLLLAVIAIRAAQNWLRRPASLRAMAAYVAAAIVLLYTHYLPGLALIAGATALGLWRRQWRQLAGVAAIAVLYLPWIGVFLSTARLVGAATPYHLAPNALAEHALKLSYAFLVFNFGETIPPWVLVLAMALGPALVWALWKAWRKTVRPPVLFLLLALASYVAAVSWVSLPFVPARLLFLLPFYYLFLLRGIDSGRRAGVLLYAGLLVAACGGLASYYRRQDFLNKGYLVDYAEITRMLRAHSGQERPLVLLDRYTMPGGRELHAAGFTSEIAMVDSSQAADYVLRQVEHHSPALVWYVRNSRDTTPGRINDHLLGELSRQYGVRPHGFVPYSALDRRAMRFLGFREAPTHVVGALELRPRHGP